MLEDGKVMLLWRDKVNGGYLVLISNLDLPVLKVVSGVYSSRTGRSLASTFHEWFAASSFVTTSPKRAKRDCLVS